MCVWRRFTISSTQPVACLGMCWHYARANRSHGQHDRRCWSLAATNARSITRRRSSTILLKWSTFVSCQSSLVRNRSASVSSASRTCMRRYARWPYESRRTLHWLQLAGQTTQWLGGLRATSAIGRRHWLVQLAYRGTKVCATSPALT